MVSLIRGFGFFAGFCVVFAVVFGMAYAVSPKPSILLVDDDRDYLSGRGNYRGYFESVLEYYYGYSCDTILGSGDCDIVESDEFDPWNGPDYDAMKNYDIVIWFTGDSYEYTLTSDDMDNLEDYLDGGGFLFLTGESIGFNIRYTPFYGDYLKSDLVTPNFLSYYDYPSGNFDIYRALPRGISDDPVTDDLLDLGIDVWSGAQNQNYPSEIKPFGSYVDEIFHYSYYYDEKIAGEWYYGLYAQSDRVSAVRVDNGTYKLVYFAFGFEGLGWYNRKIVMGRVLAYLSAPQMRDINVDPVVTKSDPVISAFCRDYELYSYVNASEYFVRSSDIAGPSKEDYGDGALLAPMDGIFDYKYEWVNGGVDVSGLDDGEYTAYVHCQDKSGYWGKFDTFNFTVDKTAPAPPEIMIEYGHNFTDGVMPMLSITDISWGGNRPDYIAFSCDNSNYTDWISWTTYYYWFSITGIGCGFSDGVKTVYVKARDEAGNVPTFDPDSDDIVLDRVAPVYVVEDFYPLNGSYVPGSVDVSYNVTEDWEFHYFYYDGTEDNTGTIYSSNGTMPLVWSTEGEKRLDMWAYDKAGNVNYTYLNYIVDLHAPVFDSVEPVNGSYVRTCDNVSVNVSDNYNLSLFWYNNNAGSGNVSLDANSNFNPNWTMEGEHFLDVWANDSAGNLNHTTYRFVVDSSPPGIYNISYQNESNVTAGFSFVVNTTDNYYVSFRYYNNGSNPVNGTFSDLVPFVPGWVEDGWNDLLLWVIDGTGNVYSVLYSYFVDSTVPYIVSVSPVSGSFIRSDSNVTIDADDSGVGISGLLYYNGSGNNKTFSDNIGFNPGWSSDGTRFLRVWVNDTLGNMNHSVFTYTVDDTPPRFDSVEPENGSYVSSESNVTVVVYEQNPDMFLYNNGSLNVTFDSSLSFNPGWSGDGVRDLYIRANDSAGNVNETYYRFVLDNSPPSVTIGSPSNGSFIKNDDLIVLNTIDSPGVGVDSLWYHNGGGVNNTVFSGIGFNPGWSIDGLHGLYAWSNDTLGNLNASYYEFHVDTTGPSTTSNYTSDEWANEDKDILLVCGDGSGIGCNVTSSCVKDVDSADCLSYSEANVVNVNCSFGETCQRVVSFRSNDSLGNPGPYNETSVVRIDKEAPSITIQNPKAGKVVSGIVDILTIVSDSGIGVNASWYDINVTVANGTLNESTGWDTVWNSSSVSNGDYNLTVYANDSFGYTCSLSVLFEVDNNLPTAVIHYPEEVYLNLDFSIDVRAARADGNLTNCSYCIYNSTDILNSSVKSVASSYCNFSWSVDTSSWATGNYSMNFTAFDELGNNATEFVWFVFDVGEPDVSINSPANDEWAKGVISVNYSANDDYIDKCYYRYKNGAGSFSGYYSVSCGNLLLFSFDTDTYCSDTSSSSCLVEVNSTDKADNSDSVNVSFNVDNSPPVVAISAPAENAWLNRTFSVSHSEVDPQGQTCGYRVNGSSDTSWVVAACNVPFDVNVLSYCLNEGYSVCMVFVNSTNNVGDVRTKSRNFSIDLSKPFFVSVNPNNNSYLKSSANIKIDVNDSLSGVSELWYYNGTGAKKTIADDVYFNPDWLQGGNNSLEVWVSDVAGNINRSVFSYFVDDVPPYIDSISPVNGSNMRLDGNVTVDATDDGVGIGELKFDNNEFIVNDSFEDNVGFDPWDSGGNKTLDLWLKDSLGNLNHTVIRYFVDTFAPSLSVSILNGSYIRSSENIVVNVSDEGIGVNSTLYDAGMGLNISFVSGVSFNPGWSVEGTHQIIFYANDSFGNLNKEVYGFVVDDSAPLMSVINLNVTLAKEDDDILVSVDVSDTYGAIDSVFVDVFNTTMQNVDRIKLSPGPGMVYAGTVAVNGADTGNYTLNISANDTLGWVNYTTVEFVVDNSPPVFWSPVFDISLDAFYPGKRIYQNETVCFRVNVSDRHVDSVIATIDAPYGVYNYSLLPIGGNYSVDVWNITLYNTSVVGAYTVSAVYVNDTLGNVNVTYSDPDEFLVVCGGFLVTLDGEDNIFAGENRSINITFDFNRTLDNPNMTVYVPLNSPWNTSADVYFFNNSVFGCEFGNGSCSLEFGTDANGSILNITVFGNSSGRVMSVYSGSVAGVSPLNDSNVTWYADLLGYVYSDTTLIRTPYLNITSVLCNGLLVCVVNQSEEFVLNVTLDNKYISGNHTGDAYDVALDVSIGSAMLLNYTYGDIGSGSSNSSAWSVNVTSAGNFTMSFVAGDATLEYNSSVFNVSLGVKDTESPVLSNPFADGPGSVYINESFSAGVWATDNLNVSHVWVSVLMPDDTFENRSFYLDMGSYRIGIWKLEYNQTVLVGSYNITVIFSNDTSGNIARLPWGYVFNVVNLSVATGLSETVLNVSSNLGIYANVTGNATRISKVEAVISKPRGAVDARTLSYKGGANGTYFYELDYSNVSRSGNYSVNVTVYSRRSMSSLENFSVNFGNVHVIYSGSGAVIIVPVNRILNLTWFIVPIGGDLGDINSSLFIENISVINLTDGNFNVSVGNITVEDDPYGRKVSWMFNSSSIGLSNLTVSVESGVLGVMDNDTILLNVTEEDVIPPNITGSYVQYQLVNLYDINSIYANVSDNSLVDNVSFELYYPLGAVLNYTAEIVSQGRYKLDFSGINETGKYDCKVYAFDVVGNPAYSNCTFSFNATDDYNVSVVTDYTVYNKGDTMYFTVVVNDVNNRIVDGYNLTLILNDSSSLEYLVDNLITDSTYREISGSDMPTVDRTDAIYIVNASVYKSGNGGSSAVNFTVSNILFTEITSLAFGDYFSVGSAVPINVTVSNRRGEGVSDARVKATCGSFVYEVEHVTSNLYVYLDYLAPSLESFGVIVDSIDSSRNGARNSVVLTTIESVSPDPSGPGGGSDGSGGAGGAGAVDGNWTRTADDEVVPEKEVVKRRSFDFILMDSEVEVVQGFNSTFYGHVMNTGDVPLVVMTRVSKECCDVSVENEFALPVGSGFDFPVEVHVPLRVLPGDYVVDIALLSGSSEKSKTVTLVVSENQDVLLMQRLKSVLAEIGSEIEMYDSEAFDVSELKQLFSEVERLISVAEGAVEDDDIAVLQRAVLGLQLQMTEIKSKLMWFKVKKFLLDNKEMILLLFFMMFFSIYLLTEIVLPYMMLGEALVKLNRGRRIVEKTKKSAEKQYFRRQIDETVFNRIMIDEQSKLLKTKSEISEIEDYMALLKKGKVREFKRLKAKREGRHKDILKMQTMESALKRSTADFLKVKIKDSKLMLSLRRLKQRLVVKVRAKQSHADVLPVVVEPRRREPSEDDEVREIIEKLKKAAAELDEEDDE